MKVSIPYFKGLMPKQSSRLLPTGHAETATNARLKTGDLTAWKQPSAVSTLLPSSTLNSVYKMQSAADIYLRSVDDVNWVRGIIPETISTGITERVYFTSFRDDPSGASTPAVPKVTNYSKATGGTIHSGQTSGNYPNNWLLLGVPAPTTTPAGASTPDAANTPTVISDGSSTAPWTPTTNIASSGGRIQMTDQADTHTITDPGAGTANGDIISFDIKIDDALSNFEIRFGVSSAGNGPVIRLKSGNQFSETTPPDPIRYHQQAAKIYVGTATTWTATPSFSSSDNIGTGGFNTTGFGDFQPTLMEDTVYSCTLTTSIDATTGQYSVRVQIGSIYDNTFNYTPVGTYIGFRTDPVQTSKNASFDNVTITASFLPTDAVITSYVYTWVNEFGEESAPSSASGLVTLSSSYTTVVSNISDPSGTQATNYGLTQGNGTTTFGTKRLYRAATGASGETAFLFVTNIPYGTTTYTDTSSDDALGEALETEGWELPPADGHSIITLPNGITVVAAKNQVYPSVQDRPHAYPSDYALVTDFEIVGLAALDTTVIVMTKANPYLVVGSDPSQLSMAKIEIPQGCVSKRSIATIANFGAVYASPDGLVAINGNGVQLITKDLFTREQWQAINPSSIYSVVHDDMYYFWYQVGGVKSGYILDVKTGELTSFDVSIVGGFLNDITAAYSDPVTDTLYFIHSTNKLATWNSSVTSLQYTWKSKIYELPYRANMEAAQTRGNTYGSGVTFNLHSEGSSYFTKTVTAQGEFVVGVPTFGTNEFQIELIGTATIKGTEVAEAMEELS